MRNKPHSVGLDWNPNNIEIFGHKIYVDIPTGNLLISTNEVTYPYYKLKFGISRKYDLQEQYMQLFFLKNYPNINPKPHMFGNWQFSHEIDVEDIWQKTKSEIQITSGIGVNGLFISTESLISRDESPFGLPTSNNVRFGRNIDDINHVYNLLMSYGIPHRTLNELNWNHKKNDFILRTQQGKFSIITGRFHQESLVNDIHGQIWLFDPKKGTSYSITSDCQYNVPNQDIRDMGFPMIISKITDALGHYIEFKPNHTNPPFNEYFLSDKSQRKFQITFGEEYIYIDGLNPKRKVRKKLISDIKDLTKSAYNQYTYSYTEKKLLKKIEFPCSVKKTDGNDDNRWIEYNYNQIGILKSIKNASGHEVKFNYFEDPSDLDERLNPRLKISRIEDPEGNIIEYHYNSNENTVNISVLKDNMLHRKITYRYIKDTENTKKRYIVSSSIEITQGYLRDPTDTIIERSNANPQTIKKSFVYSQDGRYNVEKVIDTTNKVLRYNHNDFNQLTDFWDIDNHWTKFVYDVPHQPSQSNPICYDLLEIHRENIIRSINEISHQIEERQTLIVEEYKYAKYDQNNSQFDIDHGKHSTHRIIEYTDPRSNIWIYTYNDVHNFNPITPTKIESPKHIMTFKQFNDLGLCTNIFDPKDNEYIFKYNAQGKIEEFTDPNKNILKQTYYQCGNWLKTFTDQFLNDNTLMRNNEGLIIEIIDPVGDKINYNYYQNNRLKRVKHHRPSVPEDPLDRTSPSLIQEYLDLVTEFKYTPLGQKSYIKNAKGQEYFIKYDEAGRKYEWYQDTPNLKVTKYLYNEINQLLERVDRKGNNIVFTYYKSGLTKTIQYPSWNDGGTDIPGKLVEYKLYDYFGKVLTINDSEISGLTEFLYDNASNLVSRLDPSGFKFSYHFDEDNRFHKENDQNLVHELKITLDDLGRPEVIEDSSYLDNSNKWNFIYEKMDNGVKRVLNLFQKENESIGMITKYDYDIKSRLNLISHEWNTTIPSTIYSQNIFYRKDDLIQGISGSESNNFRYDGIKQLIFEEENHKKLDYDRIGNRLYRNGNSIQNNEYNIFNHIVHKKNENIDFIHDNNGNLSSWSKQTIQNNLYFDGNNLLRVVKTPDYEIRYVYDFNGKIVKKEETLLNTGDKTTVNFVYSRGNPIIIKKNGSLHSLLTWDPNGQILRIRRTDYSCGHSYDKSLFPLYNGLGDIIFQINALKEVPLTIKYNPWGEISYLDDSLNLFGPFGYKTGYYDLHTKFIYFGSRWYYPLIGQWISEDPIFLSILTNKREFINPFIYSRNNPVNFQDQTGHLSTPTIIKVGIGMGITSGLILGIYFAISIYLAKKVGEGFGQMGDAIGKGIAEGFKMLFSPLESLSKQKTHNIQKKKKKIEKTQTPKKTTILEIEDEEEDDTQDMTFEEFLEWLETKPEEEEERMEPSSLFRA
jgi:RHS repeat-associated protein